MCFSLPAGAVRVQRPHWPPVQHELAHQVVQPVRRPAVEHQEAQPRVGASRGSPSVTIVVVLCGCRALHARFLSCLHLHCCFLVLSLSVPPPATDSVCLFVVSAGALHLLGPVAGLSIDVFPLGLQGRTSVGFFFRFHSAWPPQGPPQLGSELCFRASLPCTQSLAVLFPPCRRSSGATPASLDTVESGSLLWGCF